MHVLRDRYLDHRRGDIRTGVDVLLLGCVSLLQDYTKIS